MLVLVTSQNPCVWSKIVSWLNSIMYVYWSYNDVSQRSYIIEIHDYPLSCLTWLFMITWTLILLWLCDKLQLNFNISKPSKQHLNPLHNVYCVTILVIIKHQNLNHHHYHQKDNMILILCVRILFSKIMINEQSSKSNKIKDIHHQRNHGIILYEFAFHFAIMDIQNNIWSINNNSYYTTIYIITRHLTSCLKWNY